MPTRALQHLNLNEGVLYYTSTGSIILVHLFSFNVSHFLAPSSIGRQVAVRIHGVGDCEPCIHLVGLRGGVAVRILEAVGSKADQEWRERAADCGASKARGDGGRGNETKPSAKVGAHHGTGHGLLGGPGNHHTVEAHLVGIGGTGRGVAAAGVVLGKKRTGVFS